MIHLAAAAAGGAISDRISISTSVNSVANKMMELEFDKEIDSLLRKGDRGLLAGAKPDGRPEVHLDADGLVAFAENAIPEKSRALYMSHLADCDRCRGILSGLIALNAEAPLAEDRVFAPVAATTTSSEPWYRRLLLPNLAYVMGGLVLVFGGLIAISVLQSTDRDAVTVSQSAEPAPTGQGPMLEQGETFVTNEMPNADVAAVSSNKTANSAANAANAASNTTAAGTGSASIRREDSPADQSKATMDGVEAAKPSALAASPPPIAAEDREDSVAAPAGEPKDEAKARSVSKQKVAETEARAHQTQQAPRTQAGGVAKSAPGPTRDQAQNFPNRANNTFEMSEEKRVGGKGFQNRNNVWYDNAYRGQTTINIRRGSDEYRKLDSGLRTIAESLSGVVVAMWGGKAYRIQ